MVSLSEAFVCMGCYPFQIIENNITSDTSFPCHGNTLNVIVAVSINLHMQDHDLFFWSGKYFIAFNMMCIHNRHSGNNITYLMWNIYDSMNRTGYIANN